MNEPFPLEERRKYALRHIERCAEWGTLDTIKATDIAATYRVCVGIVEAEITKHQLAREGGDK